MVLCCYLRMRYVKSEVSGSMDEQGHFHVRQRRQQGNMGDEGQQGTTLSTTLSDLGGGVGTAPLPSSSSSVVGTTSFSSSSGVVHGCRALRPC